MADVTKKPLQGAIALQSRERVATIQLTCGNQRWHWGGLIPILLLSGCTSLSDVESPVVVSVELAESGSLTHTLEITLERPAPLSVRYWTHGVPDLRVGSSEAQIHVVAMVQLRPGRTYQYEIEGTARRGTFRTEDLPSDLAEIGFAANGAPTMPLVFLHLFQVDGFQGYAIVDASGEVVWYWRTEDFPFGMTRRENGNFVFMDKARGLVEVTATGTVVHELFQDTIQREQHHDVIATSANSVLFLAFDTRQVADARIKGESIWEWWPETGATVKRWSSWDHFSVTDDRGPRFGTEWMHANALSEGSRGNVLVSIHYWNQIISVAPDWREIEWRLGGVNATIAVPTNEQFSGQHTARELSPGWILLFDNSLEGGESSRAVEFELEGDRAEKRWEWEPTPLNFAAAVGSARRMPNGNTLVGFGMSAGVVGSTGPTEVFEVTSSGDVVWHLVVSNVWVMFRAEPLWSIATEELIVK